ncbi:MAG: right-handed parallel beta-helix repeat-containing protein [Sedimentisphaerales bacterium]|nr:right-handed parallel beta-helix repeat-containing protein [Sedimentisphaerales bacterium]
MKRNLCSFILAVILSGCATYRADVESVSGASEKTKGISSRTYYVDSQKGDDSNNGLSKRRAWKSLDVVNSKTYSAGDTILFKAGSVWKGQLKPQGSGTTENPIRIDQYGNKKSSGRYEGLPRIDAEGKFKAALMLYNVQGWEVRSLELTNTGPEDEPRRSGASVEIFDFGTAKHIILDGLFVHNVNGSLNKGKGGGQGIYLSNGGSTKSRFDGIIVENCLIKQCQRNGIIQEAYWERDQWYPNLNVVFRGNLLEEIPGDGIVPIGCDGAIVEYNRMRNCTRLLPEGQWAAGIWPWSCDNTIIQFNEVSDHKAWGDGQGFDSDWNCQNTIIQYNFSHDNEGGFCLICTDGKKKMPENIGNIGTIVRYNLSINDGIRNDPRWGYHSPTFHINGPCKDTQIYNNTFIIPKKANDKMDRTIVSMGDWEGGGWSENTVFQNNIFYVEDTADNELGGSIGTVFLNNLYYGTFDSLPDGKKAITADPKFKELMLSVGERGALSTDKGFSKDPYILNFRLQKDSPCIGKGIMIPDNGGQDLLGRPLDKDSCCIGAME